MLAHDHNLYVGYFTAKRARHIQSVRARHAYVEKDEIGAKFLCFSQCLFTVPCISANLPRSPGGY